jgi:putative (di)nucleoside polyphosphate hydrolase
MPKKSGDPDIKYRLNVAAIIRNASGKILIGERVDRSGAWQFPQGGVDEGETLEQALKRELHEEISLDSADYEIGDSRGPYFYLFGDDKLVKGFHGKEQHYFIVQLREGRVRINVETEHPEFRTTKWVTPADFDIDWLPKMKRKVYRAVFKDFFSINI